MQAEQEKKGKITARIVQGLDAGAMFWDTEITGFGIRCQSQSRTYVLKTRFGGKVVWLTIGKHGSPWTPDSARKEAIRLLSLVNKGVDPREEKRERLAEQTTLNSLCDLYVAEGCKLKKPSTLVTDNARLKRHIRPLLGKKRVNDITRTDVERFMHEVAAGKTAMDEKTGVRGRAIVTGGEGTARKAVTLLRAIFNFGVERGLAKQNPAANIKLFKENKRERYLSEAELLRLGQVLTENAQLGTNPYTLAAIKLLCLTGMRKNEVLRLQWRNVDFQRARLVLDDSKTGAKTVTVGQPVLEVLQSIPRLKDNPYILPSRNGVGHLVDISKVWDKIAEEADISGVRIHDLRHSFASVGASTGDSLLIIGSLLGHRNQATTSRYAHLYDDPVQRAANKISGQISGLLNGRKAEADVATADAA